MQDQTPSLKTLLRLAQGHLSPNVVRLCRAEARRRWIAALKGQSQAARQLARQRAPRLETWALSGGHAWAGVKTTFGFAWLDAGEIQSVPGNDEFFAEELDRAIAARRR